MPGRPRIGVAFPGDPTDPLSWSGTPYGVLRGLSEAGAVSVPLDVSAPGPLEPLLAGAVGIRHLRRTDPGHPVARLRQAYSAGLTSPSLCEVRSRMGVRSARRMRLDGVVQIGTGYHLGTDVPVVTYEDMTVVLGLAYPYDNWRTLRRRDIDRRIATQSACYERARAVCVTSSWAAGSVRDDYGVAGDKVHVVGIGTHEALRRPARSWSPPRFLFIGVDWERKNGPRTLRCFQRVRELHPDAQLDVVGCDPPIDEPGVTVHGRLQRSRPQEGERLRRLFDGATCFVMPSVFEPSGVVYAEAAAAGLASIGTRVGGPADLIGDGGLVVDPCDDGAVFAAMRELADPGRASELARRAAARAPLFTWRAVAERLLRALDLPAWDGPLADFLPDLGASAAAR
jgi:Glycosyl transferases group 1